MKLTTEQNEKLLNLGELYYPLDKIIGILELTNAQAKAFSESFNDATSEIAKTYKQGQDLADFKIDTKLYQLAQAGDLKALSDLEYRRVRYARQGD